MKQYSRCDRLIFGGMIGVLVFAPLAFGAVHVWAYTVMELWIFALLGLWAFDRLVLAGDAAVSWVRTPVNLLLILFMIVIGLQLVPLPPAWTAFLSPETYADKAALREVLSRAGAEAPRWFSLAYYRHPVVIKGLKLFAYMGMFFLVLNTARSRKRLDALVYTLMLMGLFEALYGIYQLFSDTPRVLWWGRRGGLAGRASGTYIVANHFAGYLEMAIPLLFGFMIAQRSRGGRIVSGLGGARAALQRIVGLFAPESAGPKKAFFFFAALVMALALLFSGSRGGILSMGAAMLGISLVFFTKRGYRRYGLMAVAFCLLAFSYGLHVGIDRTLKRFERIENLEERLFITRTIVPMVREYAAAGVGWGGFQYVYPRFSPDDFNRVASSGHAHNDWIETLSETGFAGGLLLAAAVAVLLFRFIRLWHKRRDIYAVGVGAGVLAAVFALAFHSYFDSNMQITANPLTLAALLALGYAALHRQGHGIKEDFFYRRRVIRPGRGGRVVLAGTLLSLLVFAGFLGIQHFRAEIRCPTEWNSTLNLNWNPQLIDVQNAIDINPFNAEYHFKKAALYSRAKSAYELERREYNEAAVAALERAVRLNPASGIYWFELGQRYSLRSYDPYDYLQRWLPLAETCFDQAVRRAPNDPDLLFNVAWYWVWRAGTLPDRPGEAASDGAVASRGAGIRKFQELFGRSLALNPRRWRQALNRVWEYYPDDAVAIGIVPQGDEKMKSELLRTVVLGNDN